MIFLAAVQISEEHRRLAPQLAAGETQAHTSIQQTMRHAARAIEAAATLTRGASRQELLAFSRLIRNTSQELTTDTSANAAGMQVIELALRSSGSPRLPWLEDISS